MTRHFGYSLLLIVLVSLNLDRAEDKKANGAIHRMATRVTPDAGSLPLPAIGRPTATHR